MDFLRMQKISEECLQGLYSAARCPPRHKLNGRNSFRIDSYEVAQDSLRRRKETDPTKRKQSWETMYAIHAIDLASCYEPGAVRLQPPFLLP